MPRITDTVDSILGRLEESEELRYCAAFLAIPARLSGRRDEAFDAAMRELRNRAPFVLVAADTIRNVGGKTGGTEPEWRCQLDLYVYCGSDHRSGMVHGRLDPDAAAEAEPSADQGVRRFLEDVFARLAGWAPVSAGSRMNPVSGSWTMVTGALSVWEWLFNVDVTLTSQPLPPRPRYTSARVHNRTAGTPPAIIATEDLP